MLTTYALRQRMASPEEPRPAKTPSTPSRRIDRQMPEHAPNSLRSLQTVNFATRRRLQNRVRIGRSSSRSPLFFLKRCVHRDRHRVVHEKIHQCFAMAVVGHHIPLCLRGVRNGGVAANLVGFSQLVHHRASGKRRQGLPESVCQLSWRQTARRYGSRACGQTVLAYLRRQESLDTVVRRAHGDADDGTRLRFGQEFDSDHGISLAKKRYTRRDQATRRYGRFVESASIQIVNGLGSPRSL